MQARLTLNYVEFDIIKSRVVNLLPNAKKLNRVTVAQPVIEEEIAVRGFHHIGQTDVILVVDLRNGYCCVLNYDLIHIVSICNETGFAPPPVVSFVWVGK